MPKLARQLTVKEIEALKGQRSDGHGRRLRRLADGRVLGTIRYWFEGGQRTDEVGFVGKGEGALTPTEYRDRAEAIRRMARAGIDPRDEKKHEREAAAAEKAAQVLHRVVAERWYAATIIGGKTPYRRPKHVRSLLDKHILPTLGDMPIAAVRRGHVADAIEAIRDASGARTARQVLMYEKRIERYAIARGHIETSPAAPISPKDLGLGSKPRERNLKFVELWRFLRWLYGPECFAQEPTRSLLKLLSLAPVRTSEAIGAKRSHVDLARRIWTIPPGDADRKVKSDREHLIHLSPEAVAVLKGLPQFVGNDYVFASHKVLRKPVDEKAAARVLRRAFDPEKRKRSKDWKPDPKAKRQSKLAAPLPLAGIAPFTAHDLRRTIRSRLADLGVLPHVAEKCLNHELTGVLAVYDRGEYLPERRAALEMWGHTVAALVADDTGELAAALDNPETREAAARTHAA